MSSIDVENVLRNEAIPPEERVTKLVIMEKRRRICASRALRIVEQLAMKNVTVGFLSAALNLIERSHWDDIINERNGEGLCGYVLCCEKPLQSQGKRQRYKICARTNRVYDMEAYNPFCSVSCFKKSNVLMETIPESPLTSRDKFKLVDLGFLEENGKKVNDSTDSPTLKEGRITEKEESEFIGEKEVTKLDSLPSSSDTAEMPQTSTEKETTKTWKIIDKIPAGKTRCRSKRIPIETVEIDPALQAKDTLKSWMTTNTEKWLTGNDLRKTRSQGDAYREKVHALFGRKSVFHSDQQASTDEATEDKKEIIPIQMPLVDAYSQTHIRKRIVLEKLSSYSKQFLLPLNLSANQISPGFKSLVNTFFLTAHNIVLRPHAWSIVTLLLLKLLARREEDIRLALASDEGKAILSQFLDDEGNEKVSGLTEEDYLSVD